MKYLKIISEDPDYVPYMTEEEDRKMCHNTELHLARNGGRKEEKLSITRNLKKLGVSIDKIIKSTGLSIDKINML